MNRFDADSCGFAARRTARGLVVVLLAAFLSACAGPQAQRRTTDDLVELQGQVYAAYTRARLERGLGDLDAAVSYARRAVELAPDDVTLIRTLGELLRLDHEYGAAADVLREGAERVAEPAVLWVELASVEELMNDNLAAQQSYERAVEAAPDDFEVALRYAGFASRVISDDRAGEILSAYLRDHDGDADAWRALGEVYAVSERPDEALMAYRMAGLLGTTKEADFAAMIELARAVGDEALGRSLAESCFQTFRQSVDCRVEYIRTLDSLELSPEALRDEVYETLQTLGRAIGGNIGRLRQVERTLSTELGPERGLVFLQTVAADRPRNSQVQAMAAWAAYRVEDEDLACEYMFNVLAVNPDSADALNFIGYSYAERGIRLDEAEDLVLRALEIRPTDGNIQDSLGWVYYKAGRFEDAIAWLERAVENIPDSAVLRDHLADAYRAHGDTALALKQYMSARALADDELRETIQGKIDEMQNARPS